MKHIIKSEGFKYLVDTKEKVRPGDYGFLDRSYGDKPGSIIKVSTERTYPTAKEEGDLDSYENVYNVEQINKSEAGANLNDGKVYLPNSYHLSHFEFSKYNRKCGKIIASNNPSIDLPSL